MVKRVKTLSEDWKLMPTAHHYTVYSRNRQSFTGWTSICLFLFCGEWGEQRRLQQARGDVVKVARLCHVNGWGWDNPPSKNYRSTAMLQTVVNSCFLPVAMESDLIYMLIWYCEGREGRSEVVRIERVAQIPWGFQEPWTKNLLYFLVEAFEDCYTPLSWIWCQIW